MIVLDTNVISEPTKPVANLSVLTWLNRQERGTLCLTAISLAELLGGLALLPEGRRKQALGSALDEHIGKLILTPILAFDREAALAYAALLARAKTNRYTLGMADAQIAAIALAHGFAVATRDVDPFIAAGVPVINPWEHESVP